MLAVKNLSRISQWHPFPCFLPGGGNKKKILECAPSLLPWASGLRNPMASFQPLDDKTLDLSSLVDRTVIQIVPETRLEQVHQIFLETLCQQLARSFCFFSSVWAWRSSSSTPLPLPESFPSLPFVSSSHRLCSPRFPCPLLSFLISSPFFSCPASPPCLASSSPSAFSSGFAGMKLRYSAVRG